MTNAPYNDPAVVEQIFAQHSRKIAAVIVEPVAANMGVVPPAAGFLESLRRITERDGALLIFDEVITGFRLAYGGAQTAFGIRPDLTVLGKIIGGGLPVAAYGGRRDIMDMVAPLGPVYQAGTLSGNPARNAGRSRLARQAQRRCRSYGSRSPREPQRGLEIVARLPVLVGLPFHSVESAFHSETSRNWPTAGWSGPTADTAALRAELA